MEKQEVFPGKIVTAIKDIYSLQFCRVSKSKTLLSVSGDKPDYSFKTDVFSCEKLFKHFGLTKKTEEYHPQSETLPDESPKRKASPCKCNSPEMLNLIFTKMEHCMNEILGKLMRVFQNNMSKKREIKTGKFEGLLIPRTT